MTKNRVELIREGVDITVTLTPDEKTRFKECEQIIKADLKTFIKVGCALAEIRDNRLYRETHKTFEKYCKETWDLSRGYADQQIGGYETVTLLESKMTAIAVKNNSDFENDTPESSTIMDGQHILPINEAQTRPLTKLKDPDDQVKAWGLVLEQLNDGKKLTAALVNKAVKEVRGEVAKEKKVAAKKELDSTQLVSNLFKKQYQVMLDIISGEQNSGWKTSSKKETINWLKNLIKVTEED